MRSRLVGAVLLTSLIAAPALAGCAAGSSAAEPRTAATSGGAPSSTVVPTPAVPATRAGSVLPEEPDGVLLPDGVLVPVRAVSTTDNGVLDVPSDIRAAGWWEGGSRIGDPFGSTLVAAHVDSSTQGLGPFADLLSAQVGDRVRLTSKGLEQTFVVTSLRLRPRGTISASSYLHSPEGPRRLTLVTCAPPYVLADGGYQNLAVIVAEPVGDPMKRRSP